jgi:hypothetical protein
LDILDDSADTPISINWRPVRNINDLNGVQTLLLKRQLGVPDDVLLAEAGYNSADVDQWLSQGAEDASNNTQDSQETGPEGVTENDSTDG